MKQIFHLRQFALHNNSAAVTIKGFIEKKKEQYGMK